MTLSSSSRFFVFDGESLSIHGPTFAVAAGVYTGTGTEIQCCTMHVDITERMAQGIPPRDREWVAKNVTLPDNSNLMPSLRALRSQFWNLWLDAQNKFPGIIMAAECAWPVEARFLIDCVDDQIGERRFGGPYPLLDISSVMLAAGIDPLATWPRNEHETPAHNPLCDIRQSARLLAWAISKLQPEGLPA